MKKLNFQVIPHSDMRYETVGDYWLDEDGVMQVRVSDMANEDFEFLVFIHEVVELFLTQKRGIKEEDIKAFDEKFEKMRSEFPDIIGNDEPGNHPKAPYQKEHLVASQYELGMSRELGVDFQKYDEAVNALSK